MRPNTISRYCPLYFAGLNGILTVSVSLMGKQGYVTYDPALVRPEDVVERVKWAGYDAAVLDEKESKVMSESYSFEADGFRRQARATPALPCSPRLPSPSMFRRLVHINAFVNSRPSLISCRGQPCPLS